MTDPMPRSKLRLLGALLCLLAPALAACPTEPTRHSLPGPGPLPVCPLEIDIDAPIAQVGTVPGALVSGDHLWLAWNDQHGMSQEGPYRYRIAAGRVPLGGGPLEPLGPLAIPHGNLQRPQLAATGQGEVLLALRRHPSGEVNAVMEVARLRVAGGRPSPGEPQVLSDPRLSARDGIAVTGPSGAALVWAAGPHMKSQHIFFRMLSGSAPGQASPAINLVRTDHGVFNYEAASTPSGFVVAWTDDLNRRLRVVALSPGPWPRVLWRRSMPEETLSDNGVLVGAVGEADGTILLVLRTWHESQRQVRVVRFTRHGRRLPDLLVAPAWITEAAISSDGFTWVQADEGSSPIRLCVRRHLLDGAEAAPPACSVVPSKPAREEGRLFWHDRGLYHAANDWHDGSFEIRLRRWQCAPRKARLTQKASK